MKKLAIAAALAAATTIAGVYSFEETVPTNGIVECPVNFPGGAVRLAEVWLHDIDPTGGTATVSAIHTFSDGGAATNALLSATATNGTFSVSSGPHILPGDRLRIALSTATNGVAAIVVGN